MNDEIRAAWGKIASLKGRKQLLELRRAVVTNDPRLIQQQTYAKYKGQMCGCAITYSDAIHGCEVSQMQETFSYFMGMVSSEANIFLQWFDDVTRTEMRQGMLELLPRPRVYISSWSEPAAIALADALQDCEVISSWHQGGPYDGYTAIPSADLLIQTHAPETVPGGMHVEAGIALGHNIPVWCIGAARNRVLANHPLVSTKTWEEAVAAFNH